MDQPQRLGKYEITEVLGKGSMGVVYKGFDSQIRRPVALKTIRNDRFSDEAEEIRSRFEREAQAAGRLSHSGIITVYEYGEDNGIVFIAMEYVEGHDLGEYFARNVVFRLEDSVAILVQLLDALGHAHEQGVIHRDIKPANIILTSSGRVKITDFGIAHISSSELTKAGMIMGTPCFMAPEQFQAMPVDARTDVFSAGVLLFQLLTGQRPFSGTFEKVAYDVCHSSAALVSELAPGSFSSDFDGIVRKAMAKNPGDRYADARSFKDAILKAYASPVPTEVSDMKSISDLFEARHLESKNGSALPPVSDQRNISRPSLQPAWDPSFLKRIEQQLALHIGPYASIIVKKKGRLLADQKRLCEELANEIEREEDRSAFVSGCTLMGQSGGTDRKSVISVNIGGQQSGVANDGLISQDMISEASKKLAIILGPIAVLLAKRAATSSSSAGQFYMTLADNIQDPGEREQFLKSFGR